jgi:high-affinity iron transporter
MTLRTILNYGIFALALLLGVAAPRTLRAQEGAAKRLAQIVGVAVDEYGKAVDERGRLISDLEYDEAVTFLANAREVAARLSGARADSARAVLDTLIAEVDARQPPADVVALHERFNAALGPDGALDHPTRALDLAQGETIYLRTCAQCHGASGAGDGPMAAGMEPPPIAIGQHDVVADVSPALMYRIVSVGIAGTAMTGYAEALTPDQRWDVVAYVNSLRSSPDMIAQGEGLYAQRCAACHGPAGAGDGAMSSTLSKLPPALASFGWQAERSDAQIGEAIREGIAGTAMPPTRDLTDTDVRSMVAFVRTMAGRTAPTVASAGDSGDGRATAATVMQVLDEALADARAGRTTDANDRAFDAYIAFEPLETPARARSPGMVASMERHFADFRGALAARDIKRAEASRNAIEAGLPGIVALTQRVGSGWGAFLQSFLIILREGFEAILVVGAIVTFLIKTGHREKLRSIWVGVVWALVASAVTAVILATVLRAMPATREVIEGVTMLIAVAVLFSVSYWLISKVEAARWQQFIRDKVTDALQQGGGRALTFVAFLAVYREGAETALFYQALFNDGPSAVLPITMGIVVGGMALAVIFVLFYRFGVRIPLRPFFATTSALLYYMAFVFMGKGIRELQEGGVVPITVLPGFPHIEAIGLYPSLETLAAQLLLVVLLLAALVKTFWPKRSVALPTMVEPAVAAGGIQPIDMAPRVAELSERLKELQAKVLELEEAVGEKIPGA